MNFDSRIFSFYHEIKDLNAGKFPYPRFLALYPTNQCQFNCQFCDYKELNNQERKELKPDEWKYILDSFKDKGGEGVGLAGGGEPLMLSSIEELLEYIYKIGLKVNVVTNGLNINKNRERLYNLLFGCSFIRISFESGSAQVFKDIKGKDSFNRILTNIDEFIADKPDKLQVSYKYTLPRDYSLKDITQAIQIADEHKFYSIQFKAVCNDKMALKRKDRKFLSLFINGLKTKNVKVICDLDISKKGSNGCNICGVQTLIDYYGDIYLCCYYRHRQKEHCIGNIFKNSFEEIWKSENHRRKMDNVNYKKCNLYDCRYIRYENIMQDAIESGYLSFI